MQQLHQLVHRILLEAKSPRDKQEVKTARPDTAAEGSPASAGDFRRLPVKSFGTVY